MPRLKEGGHNSGELLFCFFPEDPSTPIKEIKVFLRKLIGEEFLVLALREGPFWPREC